MKNIKNNKRLIGAIIGVSIVLILGSIGFAKSRKMKEKEIPVATMSLRKEDIESSISTSGLVVSDEKVNVYTNVSVPIKEVLVSVGQKVKKGDVLAILDTSSLENELEQSKLNYKGSIESLNESSLEKSNSIINAQNSLKGSEISLSQQELQTRLAEENLKELEFKKPLDTKLLDNTINEAELVALSKEEILEKLKKEEIEKKSKLNKFDDSAFKDEALEKNIAINRKREELKNLDRDIERERGKKKDFEDYSFKNAIEDLEREYSRKRDETYSLDREYERLNKEFNDAKEDLELQGKLEVKIEELKSILNTKNIELSDISYNIKKAKENLSRAENEFYRNAKEQKYNSLEELEKAYKRVEYELEDLKRDYELFTKKSDRAEKEEFKNSLNQYEKIKQDIKDMEYELIVARNNYEKVLLDKEKAIEDHIENNKKELSEKERALLENKKQLEASKNNLEGSKNALNQVEKKNLSKVTTELSKLNMERLEAQIENGKVLATSDGVVTEVKAQVGAMTGDILFVIEDLDNIYIKSKVKEHNLGLLELNQDTKITTVATGNKVFDGVITYVGSRAITQSNSPSVEFEVFAKPIEKDEKIKVGMNAFLNIITDSKKNVFTVPLNAIVRENGKEYIYTREMEKIQVETGISNKSEVEIKSSLLKEGMEIIIEHNELEMEGVQYEG